MTTPTLRERKREVLIKYQKDMVTDLGRSGTEITDQALKDLEAIEREELKKLTRHTFTSTGDLIFYKEEDILKLMGGEG